MIKVILFDWGNTLMVDSQDETGPMYTWKKIHCVKNAKHALEELSKDYVCCLATNAQDSDKDDIEKALDIAGISKFIKHIFCFKETGFKKPSKEFFDYIAYKLRVKYNEMILIGDDADKDYYGAVNNGLNGLLYDPYIKNKDDAINKISDLMEIKEYLERLQKQGKNEKPDIFGKYSNKMNKMHESIKHRLFFGFEIIVDKIILKINQSTFIEYLNDKHDFGYKFALLDFITDNIKYPVMICLNEYFYKSNEADFMNIASILNDSWKKHTGSELKYAKKTNQVYDLALNDNEMIQTVHYLYQDKLLIDEKRDYQLFKLIYPYKSLKVILPMLI